MKGDAGKRRKIDYGPLGARQNPLGFKLQSTNSKKQQEFDQKIVNYIKSMKPFSTVDDEYFVDIFSSITDLKVMSRTTLMRRIKEEKERDSNDTKTSLANAEPVCTVADIWSTKHHGYLGVTCHWLDENLERRSRVLTCKNFKNPHTAERIAELLSFIHEDHGLTVGKIVSTITDNASNMVKAFRTFGVNLRVNDDEEENNSSEEEVISETEDGLMSIYLPNHQRFAFLFTVYKCLTFVMFRVG